MESLSFQDGQDESNGSLATTNETNPSMANLAEMFVLRHPPCSPSYNEGNYTDIKEWQAYRGKLNICLQTLDSNTTNGQTNTTVVESSIDVNWHKENG